MHTTLLRIGPLSLHAYGLFLAASFLVGIELIAWQARKDGLQVQDKITTLGVLTLIASVLGARLGFILTHLSDYAGDPVGMVRVWEGGLSMYGGVVLAVAVGIWYLRKNHLPAWRIADYVSLAMAVGLFLTRIGCFLNGCCFGKPTGVPWGVCFPPDSPAGLEFPNLRIHPTQLYESIAGLALVVVLLVVRRKRRFDGFLFWLFILLYSVFRFGVDFVRFYDRQSVYHLGTETVTISQVTSILLVAVSLGMWYFLSRREQRGGRR